MSVAGVMSGGTDEFCGKGGGSSIPLMYPNRSQYYKEVSRVKRDLFGRTSRNQIQKIFVRALEDHNDEKSKQWGFDFRNGVPLNMNTPYEWEFVSQQENTSVPEMYTLTRAAHVPLSHHSCPANDGLMDQRANRENLLYTPLVIADIAEVAAENVLIQLPAMPNVTNEKRQKREPKKLIAAMTTQNVQSRCRQPKITEYMKERKRLAPMMPDKVTPSKRLRLTATATATETDTAEIATATTTKTKTNTTTTITTAKTRTIGHGKIITSRLRHSIHNRNFNYFHNHNHN